MNAEEIEKFIYNNNIRVGVGFLTFKNDPNKYTLENFKKEDKVLVNDVESGRQRLKRIEDIETANGKRVKFPVIEKNKGNFNNGIVIYKKGSHIYALSLDQEKDKRVYFKSSPAYRITLNDNKEFVFTPIENPPSSYNINMLPGFTSKEKETHGQLELPGMERRAKKGGFPTLFNVTKNIKTLNELVDNPEFYHWFMKNNNNLKENLDVRKFIRENIEKLCEAETFVYTAVFVDDEEVLQEKFESLLVEMGLYDKYLSYTNSPPDYHMTVTLGKIKDGARRLRDLNQKVKLNIKGVGFSDDAMALRVEGDYISKNENQHITIAFNTAAKDSNDINWNSIPSERSEEPGYYPFAKKDNFSVVGTIKEEEYEILDEAEKHPHFDQRKRDGIDKITKIGVPNSAFLPEDHKGKIIRIAIEKIKDQLYKKMNSVENAEFNRGKHIGIFLGCIKAISNGQEFRVTLFNERGRRGSCYYATADRNKLITLILYDGHFGPLDVKKDGVFNLKRIVLNHFRKNLESGRENRNLYFPDDRNKYKYVSHQGNSVTVRNIDTGEESVKDFRQMGNIDADLNSFSDNIIVNFDEIRGENNLLSEAAKSPHYSQRIGDRVDTIIRVDTPAPLSSEERKIVVDEIKVELRKKALSLMSHSFEDGVNEAVHLGCLKIKKDKLLYDLQVTTSGNENDKARTGKCFYAIVESGTLLTFILYDQGDLNLTREEMIRNASKHKTLKGQSIENVRSNMNFAKSIIIDLDKSEMTGGSYATMQKNEKSRAIDLAKIKAGDAIYDHPKLGKVKVLQYMGPGDAVNKARVAVELDDDRRAIIQIPYK